MMKKTVRVYLNVRVGKPSLNAPCYQYLAPGSILEVDGKLYPGDQYDGIDTWYKDEAGNYYWSGGVENEPEKPEFKSSFLVQQIGKTDYRKLIKFQNPICDGTGNGITVAVLDTGIYSNHPDLKGHIIESSNYNFSATTDGDFVGHGTHMAGIICANPTSFDGISGISPQSKIADFKITKDGFILKEIVAKALSYIIDNNLNVDIINMSFNIDNENYYSETIKPLLETLYKRGVILVCPAGEDQNLENRGMLTIANYENMISIGTIDSDSLNKFKTTGFYRKVDYFFCHKPLNSTLSISNKINSGKIYGDLEGASPYTALTSGIIASYLSYYKPNRQECQQKVIDYLNSLSQDFRDKDNLEYYTFYKATTL